MPVSEKFGNTAVGAGDVIAGVDGTSVVRALKVDSSGSASALLYDSAGNVLLTGDVNNIASATGLLDTLMVGRYDSSLPTLTSGRWSAAQLSAKGAQLVAPVDVSAGAALFPAAAALTDAAGQITATQQWAFPMQFNRSSWERRHGPHEATVFASAARTATSQSSDLTNYGFRGVVVVIDVTAVSATPSVVFTIQGKSSLGTNYYTILASAAITGTGTTVLRVYPGLTTAANLVASDVLPRVWRVDATHADADSITYSVNAIYIL